MKRVRQLGLILALVGGLAGCNNVPPPPPVVIGHVSDRTRLDKAGEHEEQGLRLALYELNKDSGLTEALGGRKVEIRHTDTRGTLEAYEAEAVRLVSVNRAIALMGGTTPQQTLTLDQAHVPVLTFHGQHTSGASGQVFYLGMSPANQADALAKVVADGAKIDRLVLIADETRAESTVVTATFEKSFAEARTKVKVKPAAVLTVRYGKDARWKDLIDRVRGHEPEAIVFAGAVQDFNAWHRAFREEAFLTRPMLVFAGEDGAARSFDLDPRSNATVTLATAFIVESKKAHAFQKSYVDAFGSEPDVQAALAYDGLNILAHALKRVPSPLSSDRLRDELLKTKDFEGLTGNLSFAADRVVQRTIYVARWNNGEMKLLKQFP